MPQKIGGKEMVEPSDFTRGFIAGLEAAAGFADYMGGDRYQRPDWNRRDPHGRCQQSTLSLFAGIGGFDLALEATGGFARTTSCTRHSAPGSRHTAENAGNHSRRSLGIG